MVNQETINNDMNRQRTITTRRPHSRRGAALLLCLMVMSIVTVLVVGVLQTETLQISALRNSMDYERALYLAGAGVHHAVAELEEDPNWTTGISSTEFPSGSGQTYSATVAAGSGDTLVITGVGSAGTVTRTLQVTVIP
jgi:Tfp pilus assembly protein PilX